LSSVRRQGCGGYCWLWSRWAVTADPLCLHYSAGVKGSRIVVVGYFGQKLTWLTRRLLASVLLLGVLVLVGF